MTVMYKLLHSLSPPFSEIRFFERSGGRGECICTSCEVIRALWMDEERVRLIHEGLVSPRLQHHTLYLPVPRAYHHSHIRSMSSDSQPTGINVSGKNLPLVDVTAHQPAVELPTEQETLLEQILERNAQLEEENKGLRAQMEQLEGVDALPAASRVASKVASVSDVAK